MTERVHVRRHAADRGQDRFAGLRRLTQEGQNVPQRLLGEQGDQQPGHAGDHAQEGGEERRRREGGREHPDGDEERGDEHRPDPRAQDRRPVRLAANRVDHPGVGERDAPTTARKAVAANHLPMTTARSLTGAVSRYSRVPGPRLLRDEAHGKQRREEHHPDPEAEARHGSVERAAHVPRGGQVPVEQQPVQEQHHEEDHPGERRPEEACELPLEDDRSAAHAPVSSPPSGGGAGASTETGFDRSRLAPRSKGLRL